MCGRFVLSTTPAEMEALFGLAGYDEPLPPRYNIAPTQPIVVVASAPKPPPGSNLPARRALLVRWGFLPSWLKDMKGFPLLINARSETAATRNAFRGAMRHRRVLVPASGFYEWKRVRGQKPKPYWLRPRRGGLIAFAGLMETWLEPGGSEIDTAAILTTGANATMAPIHDRIPVVIKPEDFERWLDCSSGSADAIGDLLAPVEDDFFEAVPVSDRVNKVANVGPYLIEPEAAEPPPASAPKAQPQSPPDQLKLF